MHRSAQRAGGISIRLLAQNVAAQIIGIHPSGAAAACRGVMRVISADQLSQLVINIGDLLHAIADGDDIFAVIVDVAQVGHARYPLEAVIGISGLAAVAIGYLLHRTIGIISRFGQQLLSTRTAAGRLTAS